MSTKGLAQNIPQGKDLEKAISASQVCVELDNGWGGKTFLSQYNFKKKTGVDRQDKKAAFKNPRYKLPRCR